MRWFSIIVFALLSAAALAQTQVELIKSGSKAFWHADHDVKPIVFVPEGMRIDISGSDPYLSCEAFAAPEAKSLDIKIRLKSDQSGLAQVFYAKESQGASELQSVRFAVKKAAWQTIHLRIPRVGPRMRLRFDPPGISGTCIVASMAVSASLDFAEPSWIKPFASPIKQSLSLSNNGAAIVQSKTSSGFALVVDGVEMARGNTPALVGCIESKKVGWYKASGQPTVSCSRKRLTIDSQYGPVQIQTAIEPAKSGFRFTSTIRSTKSLELLSAPVISLYPGLGRFGTDKDQALFSGLEYLEAGEPSSSEKDIVGPGAIRRIPDTLKITMPLMALVRKGLFVALAWEPQSVVSAAFDTPNRLLKSDSSLMALMVPGCDGNSRIENSLLPSQPLPMPKGTTIAVKGWILVGKGTSAVDAVKAYLAVTPEPKPLKPMPMAEYCALASKGWLSSGVNVDGFYRHAFWPGIASFGPNASPDAALYMRWLRKYSGSKSMSDGLDAAAAKALSHVQQADYGVSTVSHLPTFANALVLGSVKQSIARAESAAKESISRIREDGTEKYQPGETDFGKTHFADHANGQTGRTLLDSIQYALICGDPNLISQAVQNLRNARIYRNTVPRGAQTWEVPLHTPDIMASAHLCKAYTLAYEATGDATFLKDAEYWAYTGLPFVYLYNPSGEKVGKYATIAVFGATNWEAPNWMGLPVQWCGAVYADALYAFSKHSKNKLWKTIADGIFDSGVGQTFKADTPDLVGLLPDSYNLRAQSGNPVAINPGTLEALAPNRYGLPPFYSWLDGISAPGRLSLVSRTSSSVTVKLDPSFDGPFSIVVSGSRPVASLKANGNEVAIEQVGKFAFAAKLSGAVEITVSYRTELR